MKKIKLIFNKSDFNSLSLLSGNMAMLHKEGISLLIMMDLLTELPLRKTYKESIRNIKNFIAEGKSLNDSFNEFNDLYPEFFVGMVSMGEKSGNLSEVLKGLEEYYDKISFFKSTIKNVLAYPILLFISIITVFIFIAFVTIPSLYEFYINLNIEIPSVCKFLYDLVNYIKTNPIYSFIYFRYSTVIWTGVYLLLFIINVYNANGCIESVKEYCELSLELAINKNNMFFIERSYYFKAELSKNERNDMQWEMYMNLATDLLLKFGTYEEKRERYLEMADLYHYLDDTNESLKYLSFAIKEVDNLY